MALDAFLRIQFAVGLNLALTEVFMTESTDFVRLPRQQMGILRGMGIMTAQAGAYRHGTVDKAVILIECFVAFFTDEVGADFHQPLAPFIFMAKSTFPLLERRM